MTYLIDLDDTLVTGPFTYFIETVLPKTVPETLNRSRSALFQALHEAECNSEIGQRPETTAANFCKRLNWPSEVGHTLLEALQSPAPPALFPDTLPFLRAARRRGENVIVISNNQRASDIIHQLHLSDYFADIITASDKIQKKPAQDLWRLAVKRHPDLSQNCTGYVGDHPRIDGMFASRCGLACWIVDRHERWKDSPLYPYMPRISTLLKLPLFHTRPLTT